MVAELRVFAETQSLSDHEAGGHYVAARKSLEEPILLLDGPRVFAYVSQDLITWFVPS